MQAVRYILNKLWQNLQGVLAATEHNQVVCEDVMVGHVDVALGQSHELRLSGLAVVQPEMVARLEVHGDDAIRGVLQQQGRVMLGGARVQHHCPAL